MKNRMLLVVGLLLVGLTIAHFVVRIAVSSACTDQSFQKIVSRTVENSLKKIGVAAQARVSRASVDGWECQIGSLQMAVGEQSRHIFEVRNIKISPSIWDGLFGDGMSVEVSGQLDGQKGRLNLLLSTGMFDLAKGAIPELTSFRGGVQNLPKRWITDFLLASQKSSPALRFQEGQMSLKVDFKKRNGRLNLKIANPIWTVKLRKQRRINVEDILIAANVSDVAIELDSPVAIKSKVGSILIDGRIGLTTIEPKLDLQVTTQGTQFASLFATQLFRCQRQMPPKFLVSGSFRKMICR